MQVKIFEAEDMASGLRQIRRELGPDALILSTRTIKNGALGVLGKKTLEITAAIDNHWEEKPAAQKMKADQTLAHHAYSAAQTENTQKKDHTQLIEEAETLHNEIESSASSQTEDNPALRQEFDELKGMVKNLAGELSRINSEKDKHQPAPSQNPLVSLEQKLRSTKKNNIVEETLLARGINQETANIIATFAQEHLPREDMDDTDKLYSFIHETIVDILNVTTPDFNTEKKQRRMAFIGPTGVGKTTTLAKIAANFLATQSKSIALITIDTYRIAAVEQLKVYGEIMHLPVEVVLNPQQLKNALEKHNDKELILIDTAGRSPLDSLSIEEIRSFFTEDLDIENHLVLSATTRDGELLETLKTFSLFSPQSTIFTKIDECSNLGVLLNTQIHNNSPLSYITNGQRVPEDIVEADKRYVAQLIIPPVTE